MIADKGRLLILNGSPNRDGNSMRLARLLSAGMNREHGRDTGVVHLYDAGPAPCRACLVCVAGGSCPLEDGMEAIMARVAAADGVILVSPLHFSSLSAPLVAFISRLQPWWHGERKLYPQRRRVGVLAVCGGSRYEGMFRPARSVAAAAFKALGIRFAGMAGRADTDAFPVSDADARSPELTRLTERIRECFDGS